MSIKLENFICLTDRRFISRSINSNTVEINYFGVVLVNLQLDGEIQIYKKYIIVM